MPRRLGRTGKRVCSLDDELFGRSGAGCTLKLRHALERTVKEIKMRDEKQEQNQDVRMKDVVCDPRIRRAHVDNRFAVPRRHAHDHHVARDDVGARVGVQGFSAFHENTKARHFLAVLELHFEVMDPWLMGSIREVGFNEGVS